MLGVCRQCQRRRLRRNAPSSLPQKCPLHLRYTIKYAEGKIGRSRSGLIPAFCPVGRGILMSNRSRLSRRRFLKEVLVVTAGGLAACQSRPTTSVGTPTPARTIAPERSEPSPDTTARQPLLYVGAYVEDDEPGIYRAASRSIHLGCFCLWPTRIGGQLSDRLTYRNVALSPAHRSSQTSLSEVQGGAGVSRSAWRRLGSYHYGARAITADRSCPRAAVQQRRRS